MPPRPGCCGHYIIETPVLLGTLLTPTCRDLPLIFLIPHCVTKEGNFFNQELCRGNGRYVGMGKTMEREWQGCGLGRMFTAYILLPMLLSAGLRHQFSTNSFTPNLGCTACFAWYIFPSTPYTAL